MNLHFFQLTLQTQVSLHPKCSKLKLTHLIFADDLILFVRGDLPSVQGAVHLLNLFTNWSGLRANISKTEIYFGGVSSAVKALILQHTGFTEGSFPFRYLRIPLNSCRNSTEVYGTLVTKIQNSLLHWSKPGRVQILNSVIFGITNFWCASALLPKAILKRIIKICKDFFLHVDEGCRKQVFHSWAAVCRPAQEGGLGVKEILSWNKALLAKWLWLLENDTSGIWAQWNRAYILSTGSIWTISVKDRYSECLCSILAVKEEIVARTGSIVAATQILNSWVRHGKFQVSTTYHWFRDKGETVYWFKALQGNAIVPKHKTCAILAASKHLPMVDLLISRGLILINRCVLCQVAVESHEHLFFSCTFSQDVWNALLQWMHLCSRSVSLWTELRWMAQTKGQRHWKNMWRKACLAAAIYYLWQERNQRIFTGHESSYAALLSQIQFTVKHRLLACNSLPSCLVAHLA
ncbi:uncharacterized protein LOC141641407 [Silene latifolia]|uniref:uncharacterized protein LOC141641407 n=1 Tax=Silene latifolia TaxID=37657 RepID=UPI003D777FDC